MIVKKLIEQLQDLYEKHGNIEVKIYHHCCRDDIEDVCFDEVENCILFHFDYTCSKYK